MKASQALREQLGLSQEIMARYLDLTKSLLAMYEKGKREIPTAAMVQLAEMELFINQKQKTSKQETELVKQQKVKVQELIEKQIKELELKQIRAQRKLDAIQKKHQQSLKLHSFSGHLEKNKSTLKELVLIQALSGIKKNSLATQTQQVMKMEGITSQLNYLKTLKEK